MAERNSLDEFEKALKDKEEQKYILKLYVFGKSKYSLRAIENIRRICHDHLGDRYELEVIDISDRPDLAKEAQIVASPTLIKSLPAPLQRCIGDLSDSEKVLAGLKIIKKQK
jgi:circadian clock protein KaiB